MNDICVRCNNRLALGLAILRISTIDQGTVERKICGSCNKELRAWFMLYRAPAPEPVPHPVSFGRRRARKADAQRQADIIESESLVARGLPPLADLD